MKSRKIIIAAASAALVAILGVGGTLAYFTDQETKTNVFTVGKVGATLTETTEDKTAEYTENGIQYEGVFPGDVISKKPTITVDDDSQDCYLRVKVDFVNGDEATDAKVWEEADKPILDTDAYNWVLHEDGFYYYQDKEGNLIKASAGEQVDIFTTATIPTSWNNGLTVNSFSIQITAYAVQADGFDGSAEAWSAAFPAASSEKTEK